MTTIGLPQNGWLPDPAHAGALRYRDHGVWTDNVILRQQPWGTDRIVPPVLHASEAA